MTEPDSFGMRKLDWTKLQMVRKAEVETVYIMSPDGIDAYPDPMVLITLTTTTLDEKGEYHDSEHELLFEVPHMRGILGALIPATVHASKMPQLGPPKKEM